jgi:LacI family transcriptional regulator
MASRMTIRDVARLAGVSTATVSRVLNEKPDVDATTRAHIQRIVDEQRFVPSLAGTGLARGTTGLIGLLLPSLTWPIMTPILSGIADVIERTSHELVLYGDSHKGDSHKGDSHKGDSHKGDSHKGDSHKGDSHKGDSHKGDSHKRARSETIQRIVEARLIDGLIAVFPDGAAFPGELAGLEGHVSRRLSTLHQQGFPVVVVDDQRAHDDIPWISADNSLGAMQAVRYLLAMGHRRIAHIAGPMAHLCSQERLAGYRAALAEAQVPIDPELEMQGDFTSRGGQAAADRLLSRLQRPTAIFAANDDTAYGVLTAARCHGLRVPDDVAVIGFDDAGPSAFAKPPLTTVRQPFFDMGRRAAATLTALLAEPRSRTSGSIRWYATDESSPLAAAASSLPALSRVQLPVQLIARASTTAPNCQQRQAGESMP